MNAKTPLFDMEPNSSKIVVFYLPSYSPDLNPDEYLNNDLKMVSDHLRRLEARRTSKEKCKAI